MSIAAALDIALGKVPIDAPRTNGHAVVSTPVDTGAVLHLPEDFWAARPALDHVRQAARSRLVAPDAVLGAVLARVAACTPHTVELPAIVAHPVGLTFYAGLVGPPESGKSAASAIAAELLPAPADVLDRLPIGSGEGMVEVLFELVEEEDENGRTRKVKKQTRFAATFHVDEGAVLTDLGNRSGATLLPTLRTAFTHGVLGNANASIERRRVLDGRLYVYGLTIGIQPELAGPLLEDRAAGTPQRFAWLMATDPTATAYLPTWPGELEWQPPDAGSLEPHAVIRGGWRRHQLDVAPSIRAQVIADRLAVTQGAEHRDPADAHSTLVRLKVAALLALLDRRLGIDGTDWSLAGIVIDTSRRIRQNVEQTLVAVDRDRQHRTTARYVERELTVDQSKEERALASAARSVARVVAKHHAAGEHTDQGGGCPARCCNRAIASGHRQLVSVEDVIADAERQGWIHLDDGRWRPGESRPA